MNQPFSLRNTALTLSRNVRPGQLLTFIGLSFIVIAIWSALPALADADSRAMKTGGDGIASPACDPNWAIVPSGNLGSDENVLYGVSADSADNVWAVGYYGNGSAASRTLIEKWNGTGWNTVSSPNVGTDDNRLQGVAVASASDVWAVGSSKNGSIGRTLIERWNGSTWSVVTSPNVGADDNRLGAVSVVSANDVWAVGYYVNGSASFAQTMHWNGSTWTSVPIPHISGSLSIFNAVTAISASDVWAVGYYESTSGVIRTLCEHWNGSLWSVVASPNVGVTSNVLSGITAIAGNNIWAVGQYRNGTSPYRTLILQWNGSAWNAIASPNSGSIYNTLFSVSGVLANNIWAVGVYENGSSDEQTLVEKWDGSAWSIVSSPNTGFLSHLNAVVAVSDVDIWSVGFYIDSTAVGTLTERYNPCVASPTPTSTPIGQASLTATPTVGATNTPGGQVTSTATTMATATACSLQFTDVPSGSTFYDYVRCMACRGIINGYTTGCATGNPCFRPNNNVSRGQLSKIVANAAGLNETVGAQQFEDLAPDSTFYDFVWRLADRGYVGGYACGGVGEPCGTGNLPYFRPNGNASRGQISKIVANSAGLSDPPGAQLFEDVPQSHTFYDFIQRLANTGAIGGYACGGPSEPCGTGNLPYFRPANMATRGQTSKIVVNTFFPNCVTPGR